MGDVVLAAVGQGLFDLSRGRQALLSVTQPALGALLATRGIPSARIVVMGLVAATAGYLAVFSLNDVFDLRSDRSALEVGKGEFSGFDLDTAFSRHPVAAGRLRLGAALAWVALLSGIAMAVAWMLGPWCLALFAASVALEGLYCALRKRTWRKTIVSGVMVGLGGLAGWAAVAPLSVRSLTFFAFLAIWEVAGRNIPNDLADLRADMAVGLKTVPVTFGRATAGRAIFGLSALAVAVIPMLELQPVSMALALAAGVVSMTLPSLEVLSDPSSETAARYFNRASLLPALTFIAVLIGLGGTWR